MPRREWGQELNVPDVVRDDPYCGVAFPMGS